MLSLYPCIEHITKLNRCFFYKKNISTLNACSCSYDSGHVIQFVLTLAEIHIVNNLVLIHSYTFPTGKDKASAF